jgi:hypothetical protein
MAAPASKAIAERFLRDQFAIMKKYGGEPKLSPSARKRLVADTMKSFESLRPDLANPVTSNRAK